MLVTCRLLLLLCMALSASTARSETLRVVTDIPVTQSIVSMILGERVEATVLMAGSATPHNYALRPSEASQLQSADLLVWTSAALTPWLQRAISNLAPDTQSIELMALPNTLKLALRSNQDFEHTHHTEDAHQDDRHNPETTDPHGWLDPVNVISWLSTIANVLGTLDPEGSEYYKNNATLAQSELQQLIQVTKKQLNNHEGTPFVVFHDSYHYFENRFNLNAVAAISLSDAAKPGIRHLSALRKRLSTYKHACVFSEPQFNNRLVTTVTKDLPMSMGMLDPLGANLPSGATLYPALIEALGNEFFRCFNTME